MNLSCYIVDDELHAINILADYVKRTPGLDLSGQSTSALAALNEVTTAPPSLLFLDVDMPLLNGLDFAGLVSTFTRIIFTTSYREYAPEAFEKNAVDYLLKPIAYERFLASVQKIRRSDPVAARESFFVKSGVKGNMTQIFLSEIIYVSSIDNYVEFHLSGKKLIAYLTLSEVEERLPAAAFSRIHRSYIVSHNAIRSLDYAQVRIEEQLYLPVGRSYRQAFIQKLADSCLVSNRNHLE